MYKRESILISAFLRMIIGRNSPWSIKGLMCEFDYSSGRTDVIVKDEEGYVIAFEAKLSNWRNALHQAHRNRCFAHKSYVVLPEPVAYKAARFEAEFRRRRIGICSINKSELLEIVRCTPSAPWLPWLTEKAQNSIVESTNVNVPVKRTGIYQVKA